MWVRSWLLLGCFLCFSCLSYGIESLGSSHVHEAFMTREAPISLLVAIPQRPPSPLNEVRPQQNESDTVWVEGYWEWSSELKQFVWCSGSWRRPPPGHNWIPGYWKELEKGWVRIKGFWSSVPESQLSYIQQSPPDPYNENPRERPGEDYFWMSGYWSYENNEYVWYSGKWELLDQKWIYVPPRYIWRDRGYVFSPAFWDWPLEERGIAYACLALSPQETEIRYESSMILDPMAIIDGCILYYPDYYYFYFYYSYFHIDWWLECNFCPPWWGWDAWWWLPWWDQWGLWWWWCHPGFPAPFWLDVALIQQMNTPPRALVRAMREISPPLIIGPRGMIPPENLLNALGGNRPIFPLNLLNIQKNAGKSLQEGSKKRPSGDIPKEQLSEMHPAAPQTTPVPPSNAQLGKQPALPRASRVIETPKKPETQMTPSQPHSFQPPQRQYQPQPPSSTPREPQFYRPHRPRPWHRPQPYKPYEPSTPQTTPPPAQTPPPAPRSEIPFRRPQYRPQTPQFHRIPRQSQQPYKPRQTPQEQLY